MVWRQTCLGFMTALLVTGFGCDGGSDSSNPSGLVSCAVIQDGKTMLCEEVPANYGQQLKQSCQQTASREGVTVDVSTSNGPCSHVGSLGGCKMKNGSIVLTIWYYGEEGTPADIQSMCEKAGATYLSP